MAIAGKRYRLVAKPCCGLGEDGERMLRRVRFTATEKQGHADQINVDCLAGHFDGLVISLLAAEVERAIRVNQAIKRGEEVDLGYFDADELAEIGFDRLSSSEI